MPRVHRWAWWCPTVWMKLMQPRFNLKFYELFQHPAKKTMLRYAETLKLKPLSFSTAAALLLLLVSRLTSKSTCRQQNTMPLKNEQVLEFHGKMPNVTSETAEKTIVFEGLPATAGCYCHLLPAIVHQLPTTSYPTSYSYLWTAPATKAPADSKTPCHWRTNTTKSTCRQQNTMPLKDEQVPELHGKMPNVTSETVEKIKGPDNPTCYQLL